MNEAVRKRIVELVRAGRDGHIPSAFSIVELVSVLYREHLRVDPEDPDWPDRDYFILSKGHGCLAVYVLLHERGFLTDEDLAGFCKKGGILGEHPDRNKVPGIEASTGSLGHGLPFAVGIALGLRLRGKDNRIISLVGDGECHEGSIWEAANVIANLRLGNVCVLVDWNQSGAQLMPIDDLPAKWEAFGWEADVIDGHSEDQIRKALDAVEYSSEGKPHVIVARTVKGKGVPMLEGHGPWHHRIPNETEYAEIMRALS